MTGYPTVCQHGLYQYLCGICNAAGVGQQPACVTPAVPMSADLTPDLRAEALALCEEVQEWVATAAPRTCWGERTLSEHARALAARLAVPPAASAPSDEDVARAYALIRWGVETPDDRGGQPVKRRSRAHQATAEALAAMFVRFAHRQPGEVPVRYFTGDSAVLEAAAHVLVDHGMLTPVRHGYLLADHGAASCAPDSRNTDARAGR